jgi:anti-sigma regulatory factor (Ser/Thr protein kinase)
MERWLPPEPESVTHARRMVRDLCANCDDMTLFELELIVSELATNAVRHAGTPFHVQVDADGRSVRIAVADRSDHRPEPVRAPGYHGGHGLRIIDALASAWGTRLDGGGGKEVWVRVDLTDDGL